MCGVQDFSASAESECLGSSSSAPLSTAMQPPFLSPKEQHSKTRESEKTSTRQKQDFSRAGERSCARRGFQEGKSGSPLYVHGSACLLDSLMDTSLAMISANNGRKATSGFRFDV